MSKEADPPGSLSTAQRDRRSAVDAIITILWPNFWLILGLALALAVVTALVTLAILSPRYEASTTLIVTPPTFSSTLKIPVLSVQGYQKLLESDAVLVEAKQLLLDKGLIQPDFVLRLNHNLNTRIFVSRRQEERALAPIIEASAEARSPELAAAIANAWAEVFLSHNRQLISTSTLSTVELIEEQFIATREPLEDMEQERIDTANEYQKKIDEIILRWHRRLVSFEQEAENRLLNYHAETRETMEGIVKSKTRDVPAEALALIDRSLFRVAFLRTQLAQTPPLIELGKAISDDALWQAIVLQPGFQTELPQQTLITEEVNPVHRELSLQVARLELDLDVPPGYLGLVREITEALETAQQERSAGLTSLFARRTVERENLTRQMQQEVEATRRQRDIYLARLDRQIQHDRQMFSELAEKYEQAQLARAEQNLADIKLGSPAFPPLRPKSSGLLLKVLLAAVLGACLGLVIALVRARHRTP